MGAATQRRNEPNGSNVEWTIKGIKHHFVNMARVCKQWALMTCDGFFVSRLELEILLGGW